MNKFYVYVYLDPRKPGIFNYSKYQFNFEPIYVGKGHNNRLYDHLKLIRKSSITSKLKSINKLFTCEQLKSEYIIIQNFDMLEQDAFELEIDMIATIGRKDLGVGPLTNLTDGGEGISGLVFTEEHKQKLSQSKKMFFKNGGKNAFYGKKHSNKSKHQMSINHADVSGKNNPLFNIGHTAASKLKMSNTRKGKKLSEGHKQKLSQNSANAKSITINNIKYNSYKSACKDLNISYKILRKYYVNTN